MAQRQTVIFDLDGTLIHSAPDLQFAVNEALKTIDRTALDLATIISFIGNGVETLVHRAMLATGGTDAQQERTVLGAFLETYNANMTVRTRPYPNVVRALEDLKSSGVQLGVCTNKPTKPAREICDKLDLATYFDVIAGAEPDQPKKPDPSPLLNCIKALKSTPAQTIYVGDSAIDYETARNAGVKFRLFSGGYLNSALPDLNPQDRFDDWARNGLLPAQAS